MKATKKIAVRPALAALLLLTTVTTVFPQAIGTQISHGAQIAKPSGVDFTGIFTAPATQKYKLPNGGTITAGEIRAGLDAQIAPKLKGPSVSARRTPSAKIDPTKLAQESAAIFAELKNSSSNVPAPPNGGTAGRAPTNAALPGSVGSATVQQQAQAKLASSVQPCSERSPYIASFKGTITPGGSIGFTGVCFGDGGLVRIFSANPGPNASLLLELHPPAWTDTALAVAIPSDIIGQIDQPVQVEIVRGDGKKSADLNKVFIATKDPEIEVPADLIVSVQCGPAGGNPADCGNRQAVHRTGVQDFPPLLSGTDVWKVELAKGWQLTTLSTYNDYAVQTPIPESGFEVGPPEAATFQYNWASSDVTVQCNVLGIAPLCVSQHYSLAKYSIMVKAIGPRGVSMYPSK